MRKSLLVLGAAFVAVTASAQQAIENPKILDNVYFGVNAGVNTNLAFNKVFPVNPTVGLRLGKDFTPIFGVNLEGTAWFGSSVERFGNRVGKFDNMIGHNAFRGANLGLNSTVNLSNLFGGYQGEPRPFEVNTIIGLGWGHIFNPSKYSTDKNILTGKTGLDFAFNLGSEKEHQIYIEPAILWDLNGNGYDGIEMNKHKAQLAISVGYNYKFACSNGTHNFKTARLYDQAEIDRLNAEIAALRNREPKVVEKIVEKTVPGQTVKVENLVFVTFAQGKSVVTADAKKALDEIKSGSHVQIVGTASPEGSAELNQKLSQARADAVATYLKGRGVVVDEATGKGVQGTTSNRLAIVYVK